MARRKDRSALLTGALFLRGASAVFGLLGGTLAYFAITSAATHHDMSPGQAKNVANALLGLIVASFVQLAGVLGTAAWKKWGVYVLAGSSFFGILLSLKAGAEAQALFGLVTLLIYGVAIGLRWSDFED